MERDKDFRVKQPPPKPEFGANVTSMIGKKSCLTNMLFGDVSEEMKAIFAQKYLS